MSVITVSPLPFDAYWLPLLKPRLSAVLTGNAFHTKAGERANGVIVTTNPDVDETTEAAIESVINGHASLSVSATQTSIDADGVDETTITATGLTSFDYNVYVDGVTVATGTAGDGSLVLTTDTAGLYAIEIIDGDNTGYVEVTAE